MAGAITPTSPISHISRSDPITTSERTLVEAILSQTQLLSPLVLLAAFMMVGAAHGVLSSRRQEDIVVPVRKGPGGRAFPATKTRRCVDAEGQESPFGPASRRVFQAATAMIVVSFLGNAAVVLFHALSEPNGWWCGEDTFVYIIGSCALYFYVLVTLFDWVDSPIVAHITIWFLSLAAEALIFGSLLAQVSGMHTVMHNTAENRQELGPTTWDLGNLATGAFRLAVLLGLVMLYSSLSYRGTSRDGERKKDSCCGAARSEEDTVVDVDEGADMTVNAGVADESTPLLSSQSGRNGNGNGNTNGQNGSSGTNGYSSINHDANPSHEGNRDNNCGDDTAFYRPDKLPHKTWWEYIRGFSTFFPYLWPREEPKLQVVVVVCFLTLVLQRYINLQVPILTGTLIGSLSDPKGQRIPWQDLMLLILAKIIQVPSGLLGCLRNVLWIPVSQYCYRVLTTAAFEHVHSLSLDFHLSKRTGELLSALNKGSAINNFLEQLMFQVFPMFVDLFIAIIFFATMFDNMYAVCVCIMTFSYIIITIRMASSRADLRREMTNADREEVAVKNDSIVSYETVKYFNAEEYEFRRYRQAIGAYQEAEAKVTWATQNMNVYQNVVFISGMLLLLIIGAFDVINGFRDIDDFITLISYLGQLQGPLNFFGTFYNSIQRAMISGERLLELFKIAPTVVDGRGVSPLPQPCQGYIQWNNVSFWYDGRRPTLHDISFGCRPDTTTAFVGESGCGKSTIFRLMFRYYNCHEGSIHMDGHDVKDVTINSVRRAIGVVPQETILFNESLMYNLKYANKDATNEEVYEACRVASIHDRIMSFSKGYNTKVGERGLRLSGGEKQRVAIARLILKNPKIIMLDEATSALDSETEQQIQSRLIQANNLGQDRTLLIIAHRLSTITHADQIIVLHAGRIVEKGTHEELLEIGGKYASIWEKQSK